MGVALAILGILALCALMLAPLWVDALIDHRRAVQLGPHMARKALREQKSVDRARDWLLDRVMSYPSISTTERAALKVLDQVHERMEAEKRVAEVQKMLDAGTL